MSSGVSAEELYLLERKEKVGCLLKKMGLKKWVYHDPAFHIYLEYLDLSNW